VVIRCDFQPEGKAIDGRTIYRCPNCDRGTPHPVRKPPYRQCRVKGPGGARFRVDPPLRDAVDDLPLPDRNATVSRLAAVTCFFNPHHGRNRVSAYQRCSESLRRQGIELFTIEGAFDGWFDLPSSTWRYEIDPEAVMFHKESLLNLAIRQLPDNYDAVLWIDADMVYLDDRCGDRISDRIYDRLERYPVVQAWSQIQYLKADGKPETGWRQSLAKYNISQAEKIADPAKAFPGLAWAARREVFEQIGGLYERTITGGGDVAWAAGVFGDREIPYQKHWSPALAEGVLRWGRTATSIVDGNVGYVPAMCHHLYHGTLKNRQYAFRNKILGAIDFDPQAHLETAENGTLQWSAKAPSALKRAVREYMFGRREDE